MKNFRENGLYTNDEFNKRNIKVYCFRVLPETGSSNFKRNIRFAQLFSIAFSQIVKLYENTGCMRILQHSNHIILIFDNDNSDKKINDGPLNELLSATLELIAKIKSHSESNASPMGLKAFLAIDQGNVILNTDFMNHPLYNNYIWLGEVLERAVTLSDIAGTGKYPSILITHTIFKNLEPELRKLFLKNYYYQHMCCYGSVDLNYRQLPTDEL